MPELPPCPDRPLRPQPVEVVRAEQVERQPVPPQPLVQLGDEVLERRARGVGRQELLQRRPPVLEPARGDLGQQVGLRREVAEDRRVAHLRPLGDVADGGAEALLGEDLDRGLRHPGPVAGGIGARSPGRPGVRGVRHEKILTKRIESVRLAR